MRKLSTWNPRKVRSLPLLRFCGPVNPPAGRLGRENAVFSGTGTRSATGEVEGWFSIKAMLSGSAVWETPERRFTVNENSYLILNDRHPYTLRMESPQQRVTTFVLFFRRGEPAPYWSRAPSHGRIPCPRLLGTQAMTAESDYDSIGALAELYDAIPLYASRADIEFYVAEARAATGLVLELGCGTGRILIPAARAGSEIAGVDLSEEMLERCRAKLAAEPVDVIERVGLVRSSMVNFSLGREFSLIIIPFRPFQHLLEVSDQLECLDTVRRHLAPGGRLIVDFFQVNPAAMHDPAWQEEREDTPETLLPDGRRIRRTFRIAAFHRERQVNDVEIFWYVKHPGGREERIVWRTSLRYFFRYEVAHLLARAGLRLTALYGNFDRAPIRGDSPEMIFVAEKPV